MNQGLRDIIYNTLIEANKKMTPGCVEKAVARTAGIHRKTVRLAIRDLVGLGELTYTYVYGTSFLEKSFDRPVRVSKRIVIKPPHKAYQAQPGDVVVNIASGAAFGDGAHSTTCLALRTLDSILGDTHFPEQTTPLTGLDVGTGTGILAITLAKLGVQTVVGLDIDPCAISEAIHNISLNGLAEQVRITNAPLEESGSHFSVIVANLASPTLSRLSTALSENVESGGMVILTGFKEPASKDLGRTYVERGLRLIREEMDRGWVCLVLQRGQP
jgi:ribosomal protein L11 methyltransferase